MTHPLVQNFHIPYARRMLQVVLFLPMVPDQFERIPQLELEKSRETVALLDG